MDIESKPPFHGKRRALAAALLFALIALAAITGVVLLAAQERSRMRIVSEYRAFRLVADLLRLHDSGDLSSIPQVEGLRAFGVYSRRGEALFRFGEAPASLDARNVSEQATFEGGVVSFVRIVGGNPMDAQRPRRGAMPMMPQAGPMGGPGMGAARYVHIAYDASFLRAGERVLFLIAAVVVASIALAFLLLFSLVRSLDEYRRRESRNRELLALGEAARTLAHEIKNPLGVVKIQCALLRKTAGDGALQGLRVIEDETDRLALLASRVNAFLSADEGKPALVSAAACLEAFASRYGERLRVSCDPSALASRVRMDPLRLDQVLDNLIANAYESMPGLSGEPPELAAEAHSGKVRLSVSDRGSGIADGDRARVFDLFFTTKPSGAGIGLALAKRYAEAALGALEHRPRQGGGTVFVLELPEAKGEPS